MHALAALGHEDVRLWWREIVVADVVQLMIYDDGNENNLNHHKLKRLRRITIAAKVSVVLRACDTCCLQVARFLGEMEHAIPQCKEWQGLAGGGGDGDDDYADAD